MATATSTLINDYMAAKALSNALRNEISARLNSELTPEQFIALKLASAGDICATELAKRCDVKGPSLSRMLDTLEGLKAIKRVHNPSDTRRTIVRIQANGVKLLRAAS